jgi:negative regulator of sigma E activity
MMERSMALPVEEVVLLPNDEALLVQHLAECENCRAYQNSMNHLTNSLRSIESVPVPKGLSDRIMMAIESEEPVQANVVPLHQKTPSKRGFWLRPLMATAATVLLLVLAYPMLKTDEQQLALQPEQTVATAPATNQAATAQPLPEKTETLTANRPVQPKPTSSTGTIRHPNAPVLLENASKPEPELIASSDVMTLDGSREGEPESYADPVGNLVGF